MSPTAKAIEVEMPARRPFFTTATLARYLAVSERTIRDMLKREDIPSYKVAGARRIDPVDVDSYLAEHRDGKAAA
jgi:putative molybdopterin biosynthesis protein